MTKQIAIIGGGISGLALALYLRDSGHGVVLIERDAAPPELSPEQAFEHWARPGVPQFRHAHMFLARLQTLLRDDHPDLHAALRAAGLELSQLDEVLPEAHVGLTPTPQDADLLHLWGRRPTLEYVTRRLVGGLPHVRFLHEATVDRLVTEVEGDLVRVTGVEYVQRGERHRLDADLIVDGSGKRSRVPGFLDALGVRCDEHSVPTDRIYVCRHYRLKDGARSPVRRGTGANLEFFGYATFYAEHGHFALTLSCPNEETSLSARMRRVDGFEAICRELPEMRPWLEASEPVSKVLGAGEFKNRWTRFAVDGGRRLAGLLAIGDAQLETNPIYGRGCASAFMQAKALRSALDDEADPVAMAALYYARCRAALQMHFDFCIGTDRMFKTDGMRTRGEALPARDRFLRWGYERAWLPAMNRSPLVAREMLKAMQMREPSPLAVRLAMVFQIVMAYWRGLLGLGARQAAPPLPDRRVFLPRVGVDPNDAQLPVDRSMATPARAEDP